MPHDRGFAQAAMALVKKESLVMNNNKSSPRKSHRNKQQHSQNNKTWRELFFQLVAVVVTVLSSRCILFQEPHIVILISFACIVLAFCVSLQQRRLTDLFIVSDAQSDLRGELNDVQQNNARLQRDKRSLTRQVTKLQELEHNLNQAATLQGHNIKVLMNQVDSYRKGRQQRQVVVDTDVIQAKIIKTLFRVVKRGKDGSGKFGIDPTEANLLLPELWALEHVRFSELNFRKTILQKGGASSQGLNLDGLLAVVKNVMNGDKLPHQERIFNYEC